MNQAHDFYLDELLSNLSLVAEKPGNLKYYIKDAIYRPLPRSKTVRFCDLILIYHGNNAFPDGYGIPIELKGNHNKRSSALEQIVNGGNFIHNELGLSVPHGKFVVYHQGAYDYENINFKRAKDVGNNSQLRLF